jgi:RNA polymerase sigma-32 factor
MGSSVENVVRRSIKPCLVTPSAFREVRQVLMAYDGSEGDDEDGPPAPSSYLPDMRMEPSICLEREDTEQDDRERLYAALSGLDERSKTILKARWLSEKKQTLHELAEQFGVSAERIRQIEKNAMNKMRLQLEV